MQRLADVELQLVMHGLAAREILKLARCSRCLLHAADAPFAWQHTRLCVDAKLESNIAILRRIIGWFRHPSTASGESPQLVRHTKVTLRWRGDDGYLAVLATASRVPALALYELDASNCGLFDPSHWTLVLGSPCMQQLRVLRMDSGTHYGATHSVAMKAVVQLPHLHTLHMRPPYYACSYASNLGLLSQVPALTALHIHDTFAALYSARIAACSKLVELAVYWPSSRGPCWPSFFARPQIQQLRSLKLDRFKVLRQEEEEFVASFTGMRHLHTLHLASCDGIAVLMPALAHAPMLRLLTIEPDLRWARDDDEVLTTTTTVPSASVLAALLVVAPHIHCVFIVRSNKMTSLLQKRFEPHAILAAVHYMIQPEYSWSKDE